MPGVAETLHEFGKGNLHSGSKTGPVVKSRAQAIAIGLSEKRKAAGKKANPFKKGAIQRKAFGAK